MSNKTSITMNLSQPEVKLILRLRQLRKVSETRLFLVTTSPLSLCVMGQIEILEACLSGSGLGL